jgi:HSP20 family protein
MRVRYRFVSVAYGGKPANLEQLQRGGWNWFHPMPYARQEAWRPPIDVYETEDEMVVMMELAGIKEEDVDVTLFHDMVVVSGSRVDTARPEKVRYHEVGINFGRFRSEVFLPMKVSPDCVDAHYENGFLTIRLSKVCQP